MRVFFTNLGCKLNQAEIDDLSRRFHAAGHARVAALDEAELHVINSCTVTHLAARDSRKIARRGRRINPAMRTVLTGCYATDAPVEAAALEGVDLVVTNDAKDVLLERVHAAFPDVVPARGEADAVPIPYVPMAFGHARALVKVEDGCNMGCAFCIIPSTRGRQRSRPVHAVVAEVDALGRGGYREVVVTGVQISEYADDGRRLYDLVGALLAETTVPRLRLTSIAPWKFDARLLDHWSDPRLCRHVHMSLQSGCTATLRRMRRPYSATQYADLVGQLREAIPGVAITTDVIVGFPGETDEEFADSLAFVEQMAFAKPHIFTYSQREGTRAATLPDQIPHATKKARVAEMLDVARASERAFDAEHIGRRLPVLWEEQRAGRWRGLTDNYIRVTADAAGTTDLTGEIADAVLERRGPAGVEARLADTDAPFRSVASTGPLTVVA